MTRPTPPSTYLAQNIAISADDIRQFVAKIDNALDDGQGSAVTKACEALGHHGLLAKPGSTEDIMAVLPSDNTQLWMKEVEIKLGLNKEVGYCTVWTGSYWRKDIYLAALETAQHDRYVLGKSYKEVLASMQEVMLQGKQAGPGGKEPYLAQWEGM